MRERLDQLLLLIKENIRMLLGLAVVLFVVLLFAFLLANRENTKVTVNGETFKVKVADTDKERQVGLSNRKNLSEDQGMLFVFDAPGEYAFWMKNMKFPIDIIYLKGGRVVEVFESAQPAGESPKIYQPSKQADKVLEINAGLSRKLNIKKDTSVKIENL